MPFGTVGHAEGAMVTVVVTVLNLVSSLGNAEDAAMLVIMTVLVLTSPSRASSSLNTQRMLRW